MNECERSKIQIRQKEEKLVRKILAEKAAREKRPLTIGGSFGLLFVIGLFVAGLVVAGKWLFNILASNLGPPANPVVGSTWQAIDGMTIVYVPAGEFTMGSENGRYNEKPIHTVYLDAFWIDQTEVTNAMYARCVSAGFCKEPAMTNSNRIPVYYGKFAFNNYPVVYVDWNDAKTYCEWIGRRLPTEAEWEKAARSTDGRTYPWGEGIDCDKANYNRSCVGGTSPVGVYESGKSPYEVYDMAGNVWEWVNDWYGKTYYQSSPSSTPLGPDTGQYRVLRGGSFSNGRDESIRSAERGGYLPDSSNSFVGFRCARSAE